MDCVIEVVPPNCQLICGTCSKIVQEYVPWEGHTDREAEWFRYLSPVIDHSLRDTD